MTKYPLTFQEDLMLLVLGLAVLCAVLAVGAWLSDWLGRRWPDRAKGPHHD